jgi:hypothetical protein
MRAGELERAVGLLRRGGVVAYRPIPCTAWRWIRAAPMPSHDCSS